MTDPIDPMENGIPTAEADVNVNMEEAMGVMILGFILFIVLMSLLRSQKRERKLLKEMGELQARLGAWD